MSLIQCPECQSAISDQAKSCPQCGYVLKKKGGCGLIFLGLIALVAIFVAQIDFRSTSVPTSSSSNSSKSNGTTPASTSPSGIDYSTLDDNHPASILIGKTADQWQKAGSNIQAQAAELIVERARIAKVLKPDLLEKTSQYEGLVWARNEMLDALGAATDTSPSEETANEMYKTMTVSELASVLMITMGWVEKN